MAMAAAAGAVRVTVNLAGALHVAVDVQPTHTVSAIKWYIAHAANALLPADPPPSHLPTGAIGAAAAAAAFGVSKAAGAAANAFVNPIVCGRPLLPVSEDLLDVYFEPAAPDALLTRAALHRALTAPTAASPIPGPVVSLISEYAEVGFYAALRVATPNPKPYRDTVVLCDGERPVTEGAVLQCGVRREFAPGTLRVTTADAQAVPLSLRFIPWQDVASTLYQRLSPGVGCLMYGGRRVERDSGEVLADVFHAHPLLTDVSHPFIPLTLERADPHVPLLHAVMFVKKMSGDIVELLYDPTQTVGALRERMADKMGVPCDELRVVYSGRALSDGSRTLAECGVKANATIHLLMRISM